MNNPFENIDARLTNIECLLLDLKEAKAPLNDFSGNQLLTIKPAGELLILSVSAVRTIKCREAIYFVSFRNGELRKKSIGRINYPLPTTGTLPELLTKFIIVLYWIFKILEILKK